MTVIQAAESILVSVTDDINSSLQLLKGPLTVEIYIGNLGMWSDDNGMDESVTPAKMQKTTRGDTLKQRDRRFAVSQDVNCLTWMTKDLAML